ncbi:hypothetical protein [Sporosarcina sp. Te-1]|uniref:hypothetical protein n=1 Tax=Sporosarcina sp. Te-1 TaxID=2818390 RepID=UPI001A9F6A14|nr:hypothetical protein [Sporosarcina sp. Te-1]QTD42242.1 hypothetical protein J3U78_05320 [Sporosarcina sp. Te-1]
MTRENNCIEQLKKGPFEHFTPIFGSTGDSSGTALFHVVSLITHIKWKEEERQEWKRMILHGVIAIQHDDVV